MLFELLFPLSQDYGGLRLFQYLTFRSGGAVITALLICWIIGPKVIRWLKSKQPQGQPIRLDGPETHLKKKGTPTMGGVLILIAVSVSTLLWMDMSSGYVWAVMIVTLGFGVLGFFDDYKKLTKRSTAGISSRAKLAGQLLVSGVATYWIMHLHWAAEFRPGVDAAMPIATGLSIPFIKDYLMNFGIFFGVVAVFIMVGASNAVNLTDGLDGLAIMPVMIAAGVFGFIAYLVGNAVFAKYLTLLHVPGTNRTWRYFEKTALPTR